MKRVQSYVYHGKRGSKLVSRRMQTWRERLKECRITTLYSCHGALIHARCGTELIPTYPEMTFCGTCLERVPVLSIIIDRIPTKEEWVENQRVCKRADTDESNSRQASEEDT